MMNYVLEQQSPLMPKMKALFPMLVSINGISKMNMEGSKQWDPTRIVSGAGTI